MSLDVITVGDKETADINIIWFHGYGANNWGFEPFIKLLNLNLDGRLHISMPNAPEVNGKRSWYPLPFEDNGKIVEDDAGIENSKKKISEELKKLTYGSKRLYLGGFSQGAALSLSMGLCQDIDCEGIIAISGYIPSASRIRVRGKKEIYIAHGTNDTTISFDTHKKSIGFLKDKELPFTEFVDDSGHTISKAMIADLSKWLYSRI